MGPIEKSLSRKLRRLWERRPIQTWGLRPLHLWEPESREFVEGMFNIGKFAAQLFPFWLESDHSEFQMYLYHRCGFPFQAAGSIDLWAQTYYEIPSLAVWLEVGTSRAAQAASCNQEDMQERLLQDGLNVLDLMTLVR